MSDPQPNGLPGIDALVETHDAERRALNETMAIGAAEGVVATSRVFDLAAQQKAAYRRLSAARGLLTKAQKNGSAAKIAGARERCDQAYAEFKRISDRGIDEALQINRARLDSLGQTLDQVRRTWDADSAVTDALGRGTVTG